MTDCKRKRASTRTEKLSDTQQLTPKLEDVTMRSKGFARRDQRLPESPPLNNAATSGLGIMATVRARYREAVNKLFGTPPRILNAPCHITATVPQSSVNVRFATPLSGDVRNTHRHAPKRKRDDSPSREDSSVDSNESPQKRLRSDVGTDQVVPHVASPRIAFLMRCPASDKCQCVNPFWRAGGIGPEIMLRTAEELSDRIIMLYGNAINPHTSNVDYASLLHSSDFHQYLASARKLRYFDPLLLNKTERKAFFLNVYNSLMIHAIAVMGKPRTMFDRISLYNTAAYNIGGRPYSLNMIEHGVLRCNRPGGGPFAQPTFIDTDARRQCSLSTVDPRIHFALNCGAKSCPAVRFYDSKNMDDTLDIATGSYLQDVLVDTDKKIITLPKLLQWYKTDFCTDGKVASVIEWTLPFLEDEKRQSIKALLDAKQDGSGSYKVVYAGYDWTVNDSSL